MFWALKAFFVALSSLLQSSYKLQKLDMQCMALYAFLLYGD